MYQRLVLYSAIVLSMIIWSFSFIWTRMAILSFQPMTLISLRLVIGSLLLYVITKLSGNYQRLRKEDIKLFVVLAFFEPFIYYVGETFGLTMVESTFAAVIVSTIPLFAPIPAFFILKEKISVAGIAGIVISLAGVFFVIYQPDSKADTNIWGVLLLFLAVFAAICYSTTLRKIPTHYHTLNVIFYQSLIGLVFFIPTMYLSGQQLPEFSHVSLKSLSALIMLSVFATVVAFVLFAWAVRKVGVSKTNVFVNLIPVFTALFSWILLDEHLRMLQWVGIVITISGLFVSQTGKIKFNNSLEEELF